MGGYIGAPINTVLPLAPTVTLSQVEGALAEWLEKAHGVALRSAEDDGLVIEWRASDGAEFVCQLVASDSGKQVRRTITAFSDDSGAVALVEETPLATSDAPHSVVDLSDGMRLLLNTLLPIGDQVMGLDRSGPINFAAADSRELLSTLEQELTPGLVAAVVPAEGDGLSIAQRALLSDLSGLAIVGFMPIGAELLSASGRSPQIRSGSVVSITRTAAGLESHVVASTSLRTKLDSARRLIVRRHLSAPVPFDLERRRSAAMTRLLTVGGEVDLPTALLLLDEESQRANELANRVKELETTLERAFEEQDGALGDLGEALSRLRYLERAFRELGELPTVENDFDDDWRPDSSAEALLAAHELLPFLVISAAEDGCQALDEQQKRGIWGKKVWMALRALNEYCRAKAEGRFSGDLNKYREDPPAGAIPLLPEFAGRESEPTTNNPGLRALRTFGVPKIVDASGKIYMEQHVKIDRGGQSAPRIHFYDDSGGPTQRIYIGYIGPHLPTWSSF
ncbi:MAG: hypothetical protein ACKOI2_13090 [Actinomycetota bacterium]